MADEPDENSPAGADGQPPGGLPLGPLDRAAFLRQEAELAAAMQAKLDQACQPAPPAIPGGNKLGARKDASFKAVCTAPSINWTPAGSGQVPLPYQTVQDLSNSMATARTVRFNGLPVYLLDQTTQPKGTGDERGTKKGIRSGTVTGEVKPVSGCKTVRIEGQQVVRERDKCTMNGGNNPGVYLATPSSSGWTKWKESTNNELLAAKKKPLSALWGAIKDLWNVVPDTTELFLRSAASARATELAEAAAFQSYIGNTHAAAINNDIEKQTVRLANTLQLPKAPIEGDAEKGGQKISIAVQVLAAGAGVAKVGVRKIASLKRASKEATAGEDGLKVVATASKTRRLRTAEELNKEMIDAGNLPAWKEGTTVVSEEVESGERFFMVVSKSQLDGLLEGKNWFGGWVTPDAVPSQAYAREKLAILEKFKQDVSIVVEVEVTAPQRVNRGIVGPMESLPGGARQVELVGSRNVKIVGRPSHLPKD